MQLFEGVEIALVHGPLLIQKHVARELAVVATYEIRTVEAHGECSKRGK
jgi:hypothetical protein